MYERESLTDYFMPIALKKEDIKNLKDSDVEHTIYNGNQNFTDRLVSIDFEILESDIYWVVLYHMKTRASTKGFSIDFVPKIKGEELYQYAWWDSSWTYKKQVTIDSGQVENILTNFPVLAYRASDDDLRDNCQADGGDIAFVDSTELVQLNHEIEGYVSGTGELWAWVNITTLDDNTDTTIYMYYGNAAAANQEDPDNVWDTGYLGVYHLANASDSTSNERDLTNINSATFGSQQIYNGVDLSGSVQYLLSNTWYQFGHGAADDETMVISAWVDCDLLVDAGARRHTGIFVNHGKDSQSVRLIGRSDTDRRLQISGQDIGDASFTLTYNTWYYVMAHVTEGVGSGDAYLYKNGTLESSALNEGADWSDMDDNNDGTGNFSIGGDVKYERYWDGQFDEVRISNVSRNSSWHYACYNTMINKTTFCTFGSQEVSAVEAPTDFYANTSSVGNILLTWVDDVNATHTRVEWNTVSAWGVEAGTLLHNGTDEAVTHSSLNCNQMYYYLAWSYNSTTNKYGGSNSSNNISCPGNPTGIATTAYDGYVNITWTTNSFATNTVVVRKSGDFPSSPTDGTVKYNGTLEYYNDSGVTSGDFYTLYSWNSTINRFSSGDQTSWGGIYINVYSSTGDAIANWSLFISNSDKTSTYESLGNNNEFFIDVSDLPYGDNTMIRINASCGVNCSYDTKIFYMDLAVNTQYTLDAYLSLSNDTEYYIIRIINENNEPISNARCSIKRYINSTVGYQNISILLTDGNGYCPSIELIPGEKYAITINESGYIEATYDMFPIPITYIEDRYFIFKIYYPDIEPVDPHIESEEITFTASRSGTILTITYSDNMESTLDTTIYIYATNITNTTIYLVTSYNNISTNDITITLTVDNTEDHTIILYYNHSYFQEQTRTVTVMGDRGILATTTNRMETFLVAIIGYNPFGWTNFLIFLFLCAGCYYSDGKHAGEIMIILGGLFLFINMFLGWSSTLFTLAGGAIPTLFILCGLLAMWAESKKKVIT